jgi:deoxyribodipyrimidine photo-lyase
LALTIWWVRRDLRLNDNQALSAALADQLDGAGTNTVLPVFVLDPRLLDAPEVGPKRLAFLFGGLQALNADLRARGSRLIVRQGNPASELAALYAESGAAAAYAEADPWPYARQRDAAVAKLIPLHLTGGLTVHPPDLVHKANGTPYTVYTPFGRAWRKLPLPNAAAMLPAPPQLAAPPAVVSLAVPDTPLLPGSVPFPPGEAEARRRLEAFVAGPAAPIYAYATGRDLPAQAGTSVLSPYLRFGMSSARATVVAALRTAESAPDETAREGAETWLGELVWREFYMAILYHFPHVLGGAFRPALQDVAWDNSEELFASWCEGRTGYPIVDAAMRQLVSAGWMHNRARMISASFLVKDLLVDWRWGERFFMQHLLDADPASNNGGWQWVAGTGTDAAPYFRVFNPSLQGARYDPAGNYVHQWVPELARVPARYIHEPWRMPVQVQIATGCLIGRDYPEPIVDHSQARERALSAYRHR